MKPLKKNLRLLLITLTLFTCSVKQKPAEPELVTLNGLKEKKFRLSQNENERTIKVGIYICYPHYLTENKISEKSINDYVNKNIYDFLISLSKNPAQSVNTGVKEQFELSDKYCFDENIEAHMNFELPLYQDKNLLTIRYSYSITDWGAAHPNSFRGGLSFDKSTGQNILINDVLKDGYAKTLKEIIQNKKVIIPKEEFTSLTIADLLPLQESDIGQLLNFWLTDKGIYFGINPYEIGTYVTRGEILFLYKDLTPVLKEKSFIPTDRK